MHRKKLHKQILQENLIRKSAWNQQKLWSKIKVNTH